MLCGTNEDETTVTRWAGSDTAGETGLIPRETLHAKSVDTSKSHNILTTLLDKYKRPVSVEVRNWARQTSKALKAFQNNCIVLIIKSLHSPSGFGANSSLRSTVRRSNCSQYASCTLWLSTVFFGAPVFLTICFLIEEEFLSTPRTCFNNALIRCTKSPSYILGGMFRKKKWKNTF